MSEQDPKRLRDGGGELSSLLEAGRNEMPSDRQVLMLATKIGIVGGLGGLGGAGAAGAGGAGGAGAGGAGAGGAAGGGAGAGGAAGGGAGAGAGGAGAGVAGGKVVAGAVTAAKAGLAVKVIGAIAVASVAGAGAVVVSRPHVAPSAPVGLVASETPSTHATATGTANAVANASAGSGEVEPIAELDAGAKAPSAASAKVGPRPSATNVASSEAKDEGPEAEVKLVQRAQDALRSSRPAEALALCNDHAKRFPNGMVTQECEVIAVEALVKTGRKDEARKRADRFKARFPGSAAIRRLDVLLGD
jgi:hypothetical protein